MIGKLASKLFINSVEKRMTEFNKNSELREAIETYHKESLEFKSRLKAMGIGSEDDLVKAVNSDPIVKNMETSRQRKDRIDKELKKFF